jgi:hypothetical protein
VNLGSINQTLKWKPKQKGKFKNLWIAIHK